jgi:hypothetical protein
MSISLSNPTAKRNVPTERKNNKLFFLPSNRPDGTVCDFKFSFAFPTGRLMDRERLVVKRLIFIHFWPIPSNRPDGTVCDFKFSFAVPAGSLMGKKRLVGYTLIDSLSLPNKPD